MTEHCVLMAEGPCDRECAARATRSADAACLRDRKGYEFPVRTDVSGRSHVYNSVPLDLIAALREVLDAGVCGAPARPADAETAARGRRRQSRAGRARA